MAVTAYGVNHPMAVKLWAKKLMAEALATCWASKFMGGSSSIIQRMDETKKGPGDQVTFGLRMQLTGEGVLGDATLEGNEEALSVFNDTLVINQLRHAVRSAGRMSQERVPFNVRDEAKSGLRDWWADRLDTAIFNQLCGYAAETRLGYTGNNATLAPDSNHIMLSNSGAANEAALTSGDPFVLLMLDRAVARAKTLSPLIRPVKIDGEEMFAVVLHPFQVAQLRQQTNPGQWADIQKAQLQGGQSMKGNPLGNGLLGIYNGCMLYESRRVPNGLTAGNAPITSVRRAVLLGAQAGVVAFGQETPASAESFTWTEELFDYGNQLGVSVGGIFGVKKTRFNSQDFGTIVLSSFSPAVT